VAKAYNERTADLPDDDDEAIYRITGGLYDGNAIEHRMLRGQGMLPPRNCPPHVRRDPTMTEKYRKAVAMQGDSPEFERIEYAQKHLLKEVMELIETGNVKALDDIPEHLLAQAMLLKLADTRRPTVQLKATMEIMKAKGIGAAGVSRELEDRLDRALQASKGRGARCPRRLVGGNDGA